MVRPEPTHLVVGYIAKAHGTQGEVYVHALTDHPEESFSPGVVLLSGGEHDPEPDWDRPPLRIVEVRPFRDGVLALFGGIRDRNDAEALCGLYLHRALDDLEPLAEGEVFYHQLVGLRVRTTTGAEVGEVAEVYELSPSDLIEVRTPTGSVLFPFNRTVVPHVDVEGGWLEVDPPEGLLELGGATGVGDPEAAGAQAATEDAPGRAPGTMSEDASREAPGDPTA